MAGTPQVILTRRGTEETTPTFVNTLHGNERKAADSLLTASRQLFSAAPPTKATWCSLLCDMGLDLQRLPSTGEYIDAETIPAVLDAPPLQVRMSDLIRFGLLLEMNLVEVDEMKRSLSKFSQDKRALFPHTLPGMTGRYSSLVSKYQDGLGMISRYTPMGQGNQAGVKRASDHEAQMLCETADGMIYIGDCMMRISSWGYNSLDNIFKHVLREARENRWQEITLGDILRNAEGDGVLAYGGKWSNTPTPIVGLLMAMSGCPGVSSAFPHDTISSWQSNMIARATRDSFQALLHRPDITTAPRDIFQRIRDANRDIMVMDDFKVVNNYGCQFGGIRGWLSTNLAEFTLRMSHVWRREDSGGDFEPVPILWRLYAVLEAGALSKEWGETYNEKKEEGEGWKLSAMSMLWLQITLLDTWLARHTDVMMAETAMPELSVPADLATASRCATAANSVLNQTTGWNPPRLKFCRLYLARLASGIGQIGTSFMSNSERFPDPRMGWKDMPMGTPDQWVAIDAVMTLRAGMFMFTFWSYLKLNDPL